MFININIKQKQKKITLSRPQMPTFGSENIPRTTTLSFAFLWKVLPLINLLSF
jgi:hypothetical protein